MTQLDYDEEKVPLHEMSGSMEAELEIHHQESRTDGLSMPSQESEWTHQGAC